jgi:hypothetical protein
MYLNIECPNCPGHKTCKDKMCDHCVQERQHEVADESVQLAVPYYYQDHINGSIDTENNSFLLRSINANGRINTRIQETIVPMSAKEIPGKTYTITINDTVLDARTVSTDSISVDNNRNENARLLASKRTPPAPAERSGPQGTTVWIPNLTIPIDTNMLHISVKTDAIEEPLTYNIEIPEVPKDTAVAKKLATFANQQLQQKGYDPRTHMALVSGNFRFVVDKKLTTLKDVEMTLAHPEPFISHTQHFKCDPQNLDQITGLVQALEEHIQSPAISGDASRQQRATELFTIIDAHRVKLEKTPNYTINATVNAAVHEATTMLWNEIGLSLNPGVRMHQRKMEQENKPGRDFGIQYAERIVEETLAAYQEALGGKNPIKKAWLKQKLKNIQEAVNRREKSLMSGELFDKYFKLEEKLTNALKYGTF